MLGQPKFELFVTVVEFLKELSKRYIPVASSTLRIPLIFPRDVSTIGSAVFSGSGGRTSQVSVFSKDGTSLFHKMSALYSKLDANYKTKRKYSSESKIIFTR